MMAYKHINSKQHQLSNHEIMVVAAHDHKQDAQSNFHSAGSPEQGSPELLQYALFNKIFAAPQAIRLREGNTLFAIFPGEKATGLFYMFDADTVNNTSHNLRTFVKAAEKMGFEKLVANSSDRFMKKLAERALAKDKRDVTIKSTYILIGTKNV